MPKWLKYTISISSGFLTGAATASQAGGGTKGTLIGGAITALLGLANLAATAPKDHAALGIDPPKPAERPAGPYEGGL